MKVRAITYFIKPRKWEVDHIERGLDSAQHALERLARKANEYAEVWTLRLALPPVPPQFDVMELAKLNVGNGYLLSALHLDSHDPRIDYVPKLLNEHDMYASIRVRDREGAKKAAKTVIDLSKKDHSAPTRLGILLGKRITTPYFPLASTGNREGFAVSMLYVEETVRDLGFMMKLARRMKELGTVLKAESDNLGISFLGFDLSLSPWMESSVGELVEKVSGVKMPHAGTLEAISRINAYIKDLALNVGVGMVGFNELMLPVGEDFLLKERVSEGALGLRDLGYFSAVCVAGVDMVPVEMGWAEGFLDKYIMDLLEIRASKRRAMGIRILPVHAKVYKWVNFDGFGKIPVARY